MSSVDTRLQFDDLDFEDIDLTIYSDASVRWERDVSVAISALTHIGVLRGNDDGTFTPSRTLNRAEFAQIIIRLTNDHGTVNTNCFSDVPTGAWYAEPVCRAKALGLVRGNARVGVSQALWPFEPARDVQYEEAVKVLAKLYALPIVGDTEGPDWYVPYLTAAHAEDLAIDGLEPGDRITRAEMARLTAAFVAHAEGRLDDLRMAEDEDRSSSSRSSSRTSNSISSMSSSRMSSSSRKGTGSGVFDPDTDTTLRSRILLLGEASPVLAGVKFFSNSEPIFVDEMTITFDAGVDSISTLIIYSAEGEQLGTASAVGGTTTFRANIADGRFVLPRREDTSVYVRALLKDESTGGESGEQVEVASVTLSGQGEWSTDEYSTTSTDTFPVSVTAFGKLTAVTNGGVAQTALVNGTNRLLGDFDFTAVSPEAIYDVRVTALNFSIEKVGDVALSNVYLSTEGSNEQHSCTVSGNTINCTAVPASIGEVDDSRSIRVYGDVSIPSGTVDPSLRLTLNDPGTPTEAGAITWTDGVTVFGWVGLGQPIASGTLHD